MRFAEPPGRWNYQRIQSMRQLVVNPSLAIARSLVAIGEEDRITEAFEAMIDRTLTEHPSMKVTLLVLGIPSAFTPQMIIQLTEVGREDVFPSFIKYLEASGNAYSSIQDPGILTRFYEPMIRFTAISLPGDYKEKVPPIFPTYIWESMDHATLCMGMYSLRLYYCNIAADFSARLSLVADFKHTVQYRVMVEQAREVVALVVGSIPFVFGWMRENVHCRADFTEHHPDDYMLPHLLTPLLGVLTSPFSSEQQRGQVEATLRYIANVKGIGLANAMLDLYKQKHTVQLFNRG